VEWEKSVEKKVYFVYMKSMLCEVKKEEVGQNEREGEKKDERNLCEICSIALWNEFFDQRCSE
jgi:hypothetical protein